MQLDRTRIVIRPRGVWELLDLSLCVCRQFIGPLLIVNGLLVLPAALINAYFLHWIVRDELSASTITRYLWTMSIAVFLEAPLVTAPTTVLLGRAMFQQPIHPRAVLRDLYEGAFRLIWYTGIVRLGIVPWVAFFWLEPTPDLSRAETLLFCLAMYAFFVRGFRPFLNEIILLERLPWRATGAGKMTVAKRNRALHLPSGGDLFGRAFVIGAASMMLTLVFALSFWYAIGIVTNQWQMGPLMVEWIVPACMWLVVVYAMVVNFLSYLDLRIRQEGWEVELRIRAAGLEMLKGEVL